MPPVLTRCDCLLSRSHASPMASLEGLCNQLQPPSVPSSSALPFVVLLSSYIYHASRNLHASSDSLEICLHVVRELLACTPPLIAPRQPYIIPGSQRLSSAQIPVQGERI